VTQMTGPQAPAADSVATGEPPLVVVLGAPGSGKGTQSSRLAALLGAVHVSTGDVLREEVRKGSPLGRHVRTFIETGRLVPDSLVVDVVVNVLERHQRAAAVLLDGFPRTVGQAEQLERLFQPVRLAVALVVPRPVLVRRIATRGRSDDAGEIVHDRLAAYYRETRPLLDWYATRGVLVLVDGDRAVDEVTASLTRSLRSAGIGEPGLLCASG